nr:MAG TPA: hypothetical protein [Caudoviricetes sp.]DAS69382.1 MAG TPA: hypothetical protein [Caudoviricetes sp.]
MLSFLCRQSLDKNKKRRFSRKIVLVYLHN